MNLKLEKNNSLDIAFSDLAVSCGAITFDEFKEWVIYVIKQEDEVPNYFFDILDETDRDQYVLHGHKRVLGFTPSTEMSKTERMALEAIAYKRFNDNFSDFSSKDDAFTALKERPNIEKKFRDLFPFIQW